MPNKKNALDRLDNVSRSLLEVIAEVEELKHEFHAAVEMNTHLRLENSKLRERLEEVNQAQAEKESTPNNDSLELIYRDGFHVCTTFYGQRRDSKDECFFCTELLDRK